MSGDERLDELICEGEMEKDAIMDRMIKLNRDRYKDVRLKELFYKHATRTRSGEWCTSEEGFLSFLHKHGALPLSLQEQGRILYQVFLYLSVFPFVRSPPKAMTVEEFFRACEFSDLLELRLSGGHTRESWRYRTKSDRRRLVFQSLATARDGRKLPFDAEEWSRQAAWRSSELDGVSSQDPEAQCSNYDEHGDEMYYDTLCFIWASQWRLAGPVVPLEHFRGLARELHGDDLHLHHLSIPRDRFRCLVKFLLLGQFGNTGGMEISKFSDLDRVVNSMVRPFFRIAGVGITWPMFDDAMRLMPYLLQPISEIATRFSRTKPSRPAVSAMKGLLSDYETSLTLARFAQLRLCFGCDLIWNKLRAPQRYEAPCNVTCVLDSLNAAEPRNAGRLTILLIYGKTSHTDEDVIFGAVIPNPSVDVSAIHDASKEYYYARSCCLFELSPGHDISRGNIGRPGWTASRDRLCFGDTADGAAMILEASMTRATLIKNVNQTNPIYSVSPWREDGLVEVCIESIEVWKATRRS